MPFACIVSGPLRHHPPASALFLDSPVFTESICFPFCVHRFHSCFQKIPRNGESGDQIQAALSTLFVMDKEDRPYKVLLILNHAEEVSCQAALSILRTQGTF